MSEELVEQAVVTQAQDAERRARFPVGAVTTFDDLALAGREPAIDALRESEPVSWCPAIDGWIITSRDALRQALSSPLLTVESSANLVRRSLGTMMLTVDGDEHDRLRRPVDAPFKPGVIEQSYAGPIRLLVDELIDSFVDSGQTRLDDSFAAPFAVRMAGTALGLSLDDIPKIDGFYSAFAAGMVYDGDPEPARTADRAREQLDLILHAELARHRDQPGRSVTSILAVDGQGLTGEEIVAQLRVVLFGAIETIQASVLTTLHLLLIHPEQLRAVRADLSLLGNAQEEARRLVPPVAFCERWTRDLVAIDGVDIPAGQFVLLSFVGANRDPRTFDDPARFDITRSNARRSVSFSFGVHACLGMHLARLQTDIALRQLLHRLPGLELVSAVPPAGFAFRRPADVIVRWNP